MSMGGLMHMPSSCTKLLCLRRLHDRRDFTHISNNDNDDAMIYDI